MATFIKESGVMTRPMGKESISTTMEPFMKETGKRTSSMDTVLRRGQMKQDMKELTLTGRSMDKANFSGTTERVTRENSA